MRLTTAQQHGAYLLLLLHYYKHGPLPNDDVLMASIARVPSGEWNESVGPLVRTLFEKQSDGLLHDRSVDEDLASIRGKSFKCRQAAYKRHNAPKPEARPSEAVAVIEPVEVVVGPPVNANIAPQDKPLLFSLQEIKSYRGHLHLQQYRGTHKGTDLSNPNQPIQIYAGTKKTHVMLKSTIEKVVAAMGKPDTWKGNWQVLIDWLNKGIERETILEAIQATIESIRRNGKTIPIGSLRFFDNAVHDAHTMKRSAA
jgi:uncharacterized protein YdaU (DUF1376 family)